MAELLQALETLLGGDGEKRAVEMRLVRKYGRPFLLLPASSRLAAQTLALYPAQTLRARLARRGLRTALRVGLPFGTEKILVPVSQANPFVRFIGNSAVTSYEVMPSFGILAGNPNAEGQRFVFLVFSGTNRPDIVVKAGITDEATKLVRREKDFLRNAPRLSGIPRLRDAFESSHLEAIALDFVGGESPGVRDEREIPTVLTSWIKSGQSVPIRETRVWTELRQRCATLPLFAELTAVLNDRIVTPVMFHGDLAPWNIKVSASGAWSVFDWERGDLNGLPGYDWFHYLIQTRILVARRPTPFLVDQLEQLFASEPFERYAALTRIAGIERQLVMAYLLHHNEVIRPGEGLNEGKELLRVLMGRHWTR